MFRMTTSIQSLKWNGHLWSELRSPAICTGGNTFKVTSIDLLFHIFHIWGRVDANLFPNWSLAQRNKLVLSNEDSLAFWIRFLLKNQFYWAGIHCPSYRIFEIICSFSMIILIFWNLFSSCTTWSLKCRPVSVHGSLFSGKRSSCWIAFEKVNPFATISLETGG